MPDRRVRCSRKIVAAARSPAGCSTRASPPTAATGRGSRISSRVSRAPPRAHGRRRRGGPRRRSPPRRSPRGAIGGVNLLAPARRRDAIARAGAIARDLRRRHRSRRCRVTFVPFAALFDGAGVADGVRAELRSVRAQRSRRCCSTARCRSRCWCSACATTGVGLVLALPLVGGVVVRRVEGRVRGGCGARAGIDVARYAVARSVKLAQRRVGRRVGDVDVGHARRRRTAAAPCDDRATASASPWTNASTVPSRRLRTQPVDAGRLRGVAPWRSESRRPARGRARRGAARSSRASRRRA